MNHLYQASGRSSRYQRPNAAGDVAIRSNAYGFWTGQRQWIRQLLEATWTSSGSASLCHAKQEPWQRGESTKKSLWKLPEAQTILEHALNDNCEPPLTICVVTIPYSKVRQVRFMNQEFRHISTILERQ